MGVLKVKIMIADCVYISNWFLHLSFIVVNYADSDDTPIKVRFMRKKHWSFDGGLVLLMEKIEAFMVWGACDRREEEGDLGRR